MNSLPVLDSGVALVPESPALPAKPTGEDESEEFGAVLAKATEETEEKDDPIPTAVPLVFFFPPPEITPLATPLGESAVEVPVEEIAPELPSLPSEEKTAESNDVIETVRPAETKSEKVEAGKVALKGFESVVPEETQLLDIETAKPPQPAEGPPRGTLVAKQEKAMENGQKSAEIAPAIEQKMPVGERSRRVLPDQARFETAAFVADTFSRAKGEFSIEAPVRDTSVRTIEAAQLVETIRTEVTHLRQRGDATMSVALRPDSGTELKLELSVARDGTIQANVRCERGDFQTLNAQWPQLQQTLAAQGIRVADLSNPSNPQNHHHHNGSSQSHNFDRGNDSQQRQQQPAAAFEEELAASLPRYATKTTFETAAGTTRRWQSWA